MKLKTRLKLSFFIMAIMPIVLFSLIVWLLLTYQTSDINNYYGIEGTTWDSFNNPIDILTKVANQLHMELEEKVEKDPNILEDLGFLQNLEESLADKGTDIVIRKNGKYIYMSEGITESEATKLLPDYGDMNSVSENGLYYGDSKKMYYSAD